MFRIFGPRPKDTYQEGFGQGYRLGFQTGQLEAIKKTWALAMAMGIDAEALRRVGELLERTKTLAEKQIEVILRKADEEGKL